MKTFSGYESGYAWFNKGQLRNGSDYSGRLCGPVISSIENNFQIKCILDM